MNPAAAAAALALVAAALLSELGHTAGRRVLDRAGRALAAAAGVLLLVAAARPAARPAAILAFAAAALAPRGLPCLAGAAAAVVAAVRPLPESTPAGLGVAVLVGALALALAASALEDAAEEPRAGAAWTAVAAGAVVVLTLIGVDGGRLLRWRYALGAGATRIELPGAALVLGLALLVTLAGSLGTAVHLLTRAPEGSRAGRIGQSLLVLGAGLGVLGVGVVAGQGLSRSQGAIAAGAVDVAAMLLAAGLLVLALIRRLAEPRPDAVVGSGWRRERVLLLAAAASMLAAATAGFESWRAEGTYATPALAEAASAALLGLVAVQPTRLRLLRLALFVAGLLSLLLRAV
jgi:hypothetical protein